MQQPSHRPTTQMRFLCAVQSLQGVLQVGEHPSLPFLQPLRKHTGILRPPTSQVHEIHPSHAFLDVIDGRGSGSRSNSDPDLVAYHSTSSENLAPQCEYLEYICYLRRCGEDSDWSINVVFPQLFYIRGSSAHSTYHGGHNRLLPQQAQVCMLTFLTAVCRTLWVPDFIVSSASRWTYARIANLLGCPVIWIPRMGGTTLHIL